MKITIEIESHEYDGAFKGWYATTTRDGETVREDYHPGYDPIDLGDQIACHVPVEIPAVRDDRRSVVLALGIADLDQAVR